MNQKDILSALDKQFSTNVTSIFVNSLNREVSFRDVTVKEQKTLTKIIIDNEGREDIIYESTLAMIQALTLDKEFDSLDMSEFDRLKILLALYRQNFFNNKVKYSCKSCGHEGSYELNFDSIIESLDKSDVSDKLLSIDTSSHAFEFTAGFPNVKNVRSYLKQMYKEKKDKNVVNKLSSIDYVDLFIKDMKVINKTDASSEPISIDFRNLSINDVEEILQKLPQGVLLNRSGDSMMDKLTKEFLSLISSSFSTNKCGNCGEEINLNIGFSDFFLY